MNFIGNIIWLIFGGFFSAVGLILGGLVMMLTIIGIPFGIQSIKLGFATLAPFGKKLERDEDEEGVLPLVLNLIWLVLFGWELALNHLFWGILLTITVVGAPWGKQHFKLIPMSMLPLGRSLR